MVGANAEAYEAYLLEDERRRFVGLRSAELQYMSLSVIGVYEEEIRVLRKRIQEVKSIYNTGASINEVLPNELLVQIFRWVGPRTNTADAIRLTHVCRSWRSLIHGTPVFWADLLDPYDKIFARYEEDFWLVRTAFQKSAQMPGLRFSLNGAFLHCLDIYTSLTCHVGRISTLHLDCTEKKHRDMRPFFRLKMPQLEDLTAWLKCSDACVPADTPFNFPRLRRLRTNCVSFAIRWISPSVRQLIIGQHWEDWGRKAKPKLAPCCTVRKLDRLWDPLRAICANLTEMRLDACVDDEVSRPRDPPLKLPNLETLLLYAHKADTIRTMVDSMELTATVQVTLASAFPYDELCSMGGTTLPCIPKIDHLAIDMGNTRHPAYSYVVRGYEGPKKRLTLCSSGVLQTTSYDPINLLRFYQGSASMFSSATVTSLDVSCTEPLVPDNAGWLWLLRHFPRIDRLNVNTPSSYDFCTALAHDDVLPNLRNLSLRTDTELTAVNNEIMVFVLEDRASRGLLLESLYFSRRACSQEEAVIPADVAADLRKRLDAIVPDFSFYVKWGLRHGSVEGVVSL
ncbi:hypothetical protein C8T65DRAFT_729829 [Cerioporus squamosus]|nr:hypothetical protein C8T65DRAFT_729829 [Cerioporus squamosus]